MQRHAAPPRPVGDADTGTVPTPTEASAAEEHKCVQQQHDEQPNPERMATASASNQPSCIHQWKECGMSCDANGNCLKKFECRMCGLKKMGTGAKTSKCQKCQGSAKLIDEDCDFGASGSGSVSERYKCSACSHEWKVVVYRWSAKD